MTLEEAIKIARAIMPVRFKHWKGLNMHYEEMWKDYKS